MKGEPLGRILDFGEILEALRIAQVIVGPPGERNHVNEAASKPPSSRTAGEPNVNISPGRCLMSVKPAHYIRLSRDRLSDS